MRSCIEATAGVLGGPFALERIERSESVEAIRDMRI